MRKVWLEIFCDVENVENKLMIGHIKRFLWKVCLWELNENNEPIINSSKILVEKGSLKFCQDQSKIFANDLKTHGFKVVISGNSPNSKFPIKPIEYELLGYTFSHNTNFF